VKKARGGVASRKAKVSSITAHASRSSKFRGENHPPAPDDGSRNSTPSKAGDISFVLNGSTPPPQSTPSKSPTVHPVKQSGTNTATVKDSIPSSAPAEPTHNRMLPSVGRLTVVRARNKKRKVNDSYVFDDFMMEPWEEPDEAGYSEEEARRELVEKEIRRRIKKESKKRRRERLRVGGLAKGIFYPKYFLNVEWAFMQNKLGDILNDADRWESGSLNESDGGEECDAILTSLRRAKRRSSRPLLQSWAEKAEDVEMSEEAVRATTGGKTLPHLRLTVNGH